jgi:hypothetical protein
MTFGPDHYVPILKVKRGEKAALLALADPLCARMTPLLEIVERRSDKAATIGSHLDNAFKGLFESTMRFERVFLDAHEIAPEGPEAVMEVFRRAAAVGIEFTPVMGLSRTADVSAALAFRSRGLCLRVVRAEFEGGDLRATITRFLNQYAFMPEEIDLILDMGPVEDMVSFGVAALALAFLAEVPALSQWRTLTLSGSAFPGSMGIVARHSYHRAERAEWLAWRDELYPHRGGMKRLPTYSDCAIQHPKGVEDFDPRLMTGSAVIRYTLDDFWLLIKGESTRRVFPSAQFPLLAVQLAYGHLRPFFDGNSHCAGCHAIKSAADGGNGFGSLEVWRRIGTIHHLSKVSDALSALTWP